MRIWMLAIAVALWSSVARADVHVASTDVLLDGRGGANTRQSIPITLDPGSTLDEVEAPWDITRGGVRTDAIRSSLDVRRDGQGILVAATDTTLPGSYRVALRIVVTPAPAVDAGAPAKQRVDVVLNVTVAAPTVEATKAIDVELVDGPTLWIFGPRATAPIVIAETSDKSDVHGLEIDQQGQVLQDGKAAPGAVTATVEGNATTIARHHQARATVDASGTPLGSSDATLRIRAADLGAAVTVPVHITHRRTAFWLFVVFIVGMGIGFAVRTWAPAILDVDGAAKRANETIEALRELSRRSRAAEQQAAANAARKIRDAARKADKAAIDDAVASAKTTITTINSTLDGQVQAVRTALVTRSAVIGLHALPAAVRAPLALASAAIDSAEAALLHTDVAAADAAMAALDARIGDARAALEDTARALGRAAGDLVADRAEALAPVRTQIDAIERATTAIATAVAIGQPDSCKALVDSDAGLRAIDAAIRDADASMSAFAAKVRDQVAAEVATDVAKTTAIDPGDGGVVAMVAGLDAAVAATYAAARAVVGSDGPLAAGDFLTALVAAAPKGPVAFDVSADAAAGIARIARTPLPAGPEPSAPRAIADVIASGAVAVPGVTRWTLAAARVSRWAATVVMFSLGVWYVYSDSFIGTGKELVAIGATGFFTDVSFSAASTLFGKLKKA